MRTIKMVSSFCLLLIVFFAQAQQKIKIILVGSLHFTPSSSDVYKNNAVNINSAKRQAEVAEVVSKLAAFKPDKICIEWPYTYQFEMDSIYSEFLKGNYKLKDNERDQLAMNLGKKLQMKTLTAVNRYGNFDNDTVVNYAMKNNQQAVTQQLELAGKSVMAEFNNKLATLSIKESLIYLNSKKALALNLGIYLKYYAAIGKGEDYIGSKLVADWYTTNINIYTNILRAIKPTDNAVVVVYGQGHVPILKHLFENNDNFEVVQVKDVLK